jgi:hypothetical protein
LYSCVRAFLLLFPLPQDLPPPAAPGPLPSLPNDSSHKKEREMKRLKLFT